MSGDDRRPLAQWAKDVEAFRWNLLCAAEIEGLAPHAEQHVLLAIAAMDQAQRWLQLAALQHPGSSAAVHGGALTDATGAAGDSAGPSP